MRFLALIVLCCAACAAAQPPVIGAEVFVNPGDTPERIDTLIRYLAEYRMPLARIFLPRGEEALKQYDLLFQAAEKHHVGVTATLGGPPTSDNAKWIHAMVRRYQGSPALDSWILMNEPGQGVSADEIAVRRFREWLKNKYGTIGALNAAWGRSPYDSFDAIDAPVAGQRVFWSSHRRQIDWITFWREHLAWHLGWIAARVREVDARHPTHTNPHGLVGNLAARPYDLPAWREFLDSLGASVHPSWHFGLLKRDQFALGVAYVSDLIRGSIEPKPFWITELQGGNNIMSGGRPIYPSPEDIAQWVWTGIGSGAERIIFWLLNNRSEGTESGEWSLLDFQSRPSERLEEAGRITRVIEENRALWGEAKPVDTQVTIVLSLEAMTLEERFALTQPVSGLAGRDRSAHLFEALAFYEVLSEFGISARVKHIQDVDWRAKRARPELAIFPNVSALSREQAAGITAFARNGNTALLTGLTGVYGPYNEFWPLAEFPLEEAAGARLKEIRTLPESCRAGFPDFGLTVPCHLFQGEIENLSAEVIGWTGGLATAVRKRHGPGQVVWIPSMIGVEAWLRGSEELGRLVARLAGEPFFAAAPYRFEGRQKGCLLRTLASGRSYITVVTNNLAEAASCALIVPPGKKSRVLWGGQASLAGPGTVVKLGPRGTVVAVWE
jgi:beta-galactosidase